MLSCQTIQLTWERRLVITGKVELIFMASEDWITTLSYWQAWLSKELAMHSAGKGVNYNILLKTFKYLCNSLPILPCVIDFIDLHMLVQLSYLIESSRDWWKLSCNVLLTLLGTLAKCREVAQNQSTFLFFPLTFFVLLIRDILKVSQLPKIFYGFNKAW